MTCGSFVSPLAYTYHRWIQGCRSEGGGVPSGPGTPFLEFESWPPNNIIRLPIFAFWVVGWQVIFLGATSTFQGAPGPFQGAPSVDSGKCPPCPPDSANGMYFTRIYIVEFNAVCFQYFLRLGCFSLIFWCGIFLFQDICVIKYIIMSKLSINSLKLWGLLGPGAMVKLYPVRLSIILFDRVKIRKKNLG